VERLPDSVAALILCKTGFSKVGRNGISVEGVTAKPLKFWSENSVTIAEKAGTNEKVLWALNRLQPDLLHILGSDGKYIETIPLDGKVPWFDEAATKEVLGAKRRSQNRTIERVRLLHASDSEAAAEAATANDAAMKSVVHTFPARGDRSGNPEQRADDDRHRNGRIPKRKTDRIIAPAADREQFQEGQRSNLGNRQAPETVELPSRAEGRARSSARGAFPKADRIHEIQRHLQDERTAHATRVQTLARRVAAVTEADLNDLTSDEGLEPVAALTATERYPDEDASDCIL